MSAVLEVPSRFEIPSDARPTTLSGWIRLAHEALRECEASDIYEIRTGFHQWEKDRGLTAVGLAGAYIACVLRAEPETFVGPKQVLDRWGQGEWERIHGVWCLEAGKLRTAARFFGIPPGPVETFLKANHLGVIPSPRAVVPAYDDDPAAFHAALDRLADALEGEGL